MPIIKRIAAVPHQLPLKSVLAWGKGHQLATLDHVLVIVELSDGALGIAEATPRPTIYGETSASVKAILATEIQKRAVGQSITSMADVAQLDVNLQIIKNNQTAKGAFNMALVMALSQSLGVPISKLIGATAEKTTLSFILGTGNRDTVWQEVESVYQQGIRFLKIKIGKNLLGEFALLKQIQATYPDLRYYADANECLEPDTAVDVLQQLAEQNVAYCEEPLPTHDLLARQTLRQNNLMPLIGDDSCFSLHDVERELQFDTVDIVNIKTARTGFSHSQLIHDAVLTANKGIMVGSQASSLLGALCTILFACQPMIEHPTEASFFLKIADGERLSIHNGVVLRDEAEALLMALSARLLEQHGF